MRLLAYCLLPNHFHLALWPRGHGDLSDYMIGLLTAHVRRYLRHYHSSGHVLQGRFRPTASECTGPITMAKRSLAAAKWQTPPSYLLPPAWRTETHSGSQAPSARLDLDGAGNTTPRLTLLILSELARVFPSPKHVSLTLLQDAVGGNDRR
jgi:hypothetical protein